MQNKNIDLSSYKEEDKITVVGTIKGFKDKNKKNPNLVVVRNAFIK